MPLLQSQYRELTRKHLRGLLKELFAEFTGLHFHIAWAPASGEWDASLWRRGRSAFCKLAWTRGETNPECRLCGAKHLARTLSTDGKGHGFECRYGVRNYWLPIRVRSVPVGIAYLQALAGNPRPGRSPPDFGCAVPRVLSRSEFRQAGRLLALMIQHVQTLDLAESRREDLTRARQAVAALEQEHARLHRELERIMPITVQPPPAYAPVPHSEEVVHRLLERVHQGYTKPLTLRECARKLRLNAAYLSALFSDAVGLPFKTYLTELRLQKARELLGNANLNVCDIAAAVGYASDDRFRVAFKKATGLSPKAWRETFRPLSLFWAAWFMFDLEFIERLEPLLLF